MSIDFKDEAAEIEADWAAIDKMSKEELRAFLISEGIDPDAYYEKLRAKLLLLGIDLPPAKPRITG